MAGLSLHEVDSVIIEKLQERAKKNCRSVEDEHAAILRDALVSNGSESAHQSFETYLRTMPDVGTDADFSRVEGEIRNVDLVN